MPFNKLHKAYSPLDGEIDLDADGTRIDEINAFQLAQFEHSQQWHAFLVGFSFLEILFFVWEVLTGVRNVVFTRISLEIYDLLSFKCYFYTRYLRVTRVL